MNPPKDSGVRRATSEDIHRILSASPKQRWHVEDAPKRGLCFTLVQTVDTDALHQLSGQRSNAKPTQKGRQRMAVEVLMAGPFRRTKWSSKGNGEADTVVLQHETRGAVYIDRNAKTHLHLGPEQIPLSEIPGQERKLAIEWRVNAEKEHSPKGRRTFIVEGQPAHAPKTARVRWQLEVIDNEDLKPYAAAALELLVGNAALLKRSGFPFDELARQGFPVRARTISAMARRTCEEVVSEAEVPDTPEIVEVDPPDFDLDLDLTTDLRAKERKSTQEEGKKQKRPARQKAPASAQTPRSSTTGTARAYAYTYGDVAVLAPGMPEAVVTSDGASVNPRADPEIPLPECLPGMERFGSAIDIRQFALDHVSYVVETIADRLATLGGARQDPNATDVSIAFDWLDALRQSHQDEIDAGGGGDGLFCILRDAPPDPGEGDRTLGGTGLLDVAAEAEAERLMAQDDPLDGGDGPALTVPQFAADEIAEAVADDELEPEDRWRELSRATQVELREAVLLQRIGRFTTTFNGDSGLQELPSPDWDLLHVRFQLENFALTFANTTLEQFAIRGNAPGQDIPLTLHFGGLTATFAHTREPGEDFWITAAGVLVAAAIIAPTAVTLVLALAVLGGPGLLFLALLLGPIAAQGIGAVLLAVAIFVLWESAVIDASIGDFRLNTRLHWSATDDQSAVVLEADDLVVDGPITVVSYDSQIPSGIHQILGWFTAGLVNVFDLARDEVQRNIERRISNALELVPQLLLPTPQRVVLDDEIIVQHTVVGGAFDGVAAERMAVQVITDAEIVPRNAGLLLTQVDPNSLPTLQRVIDSRASTAYGGYGISQNLLNAYGYATWARGTFAEDLSANETAAAISALALKCEKAKAHVWPSTPPRILLTPYAFWSDARHPYAIGIFDDVRLCIQCDKTRLEFKFGARLAAHLGLGRLPAGRDLLSLFTLDRRFANVYYDTCPDAIAIEPVATQSVSGAGAGFDLINALDDRARTDLLDSMQRVFRTSMARSLTDVSASVIPFEDATVRWDRHQYDQILIAQITPVRTTIYVTIAPLERLRAVLPPLGGGDPTIDINDMGCDQARDFFLSVI